MQNQGGGNSQPYFQYSQCTGKRKALCVSSVLLAGWAMLVPLLSVLWAHQDDLSGAEANKSRLGSTISAARMPCRAVSMMPTMCRNSWSVSGCRCQCVLVSLTGLDRYHYRTEDIVMLTDDARNPRQIPTRANMIAAMQWLVAGAQPNDALFFH
jgi:hypothetical protein